MKSALEKLEKEKVHFQDTQELIREFSDLEERNLFLVEKNQQNEQSFFDLKKQFEDSRAEKSRKISELTLRKKELRERLKREELSLQMKLRRKNEERVGFGEKQLANVFKHAAEFVGRVGGKGIRLEGKGAKESFVEYLTGIERELFGFERLLGKEYAEGIHKMKVSRLYFYLLTYFLVVLTNPK